MHVLYSRVGLRYSAWVGCNDQQTWAAVTQRLSSRGWADRLLVGFAGKDPVPHIVPVFLTLQAAQQCGKLCLVNQSVVQGNSHIHLVKGVVHCTHERGAL